MGGERQHSGTCLTGLNGGPQRQRKQRRRQCVQDRAAAHFVVHRFGPHQRDEPAQTFGLRQALCSNADVFGAYYEFRR